LIGLSPPSTGHPPRFQPRWVRPSTGSYPCFSLPMDSSPGFASTAGDSTPCSDSLSLRLASSLTSPHAVTRWLILQKARRHTTRVLRLLVGTRFQVLFHSPLGVLFTFPSRYWSTIGHRRVFSLGGWSPRLRAGLHVSGATQGPRSRRPHRFAYGALTPSGGPFQALPLRCGFLTAPRVWRPGMARPCNPRAATPPGLCTCTGLGWSAFARRY
jgi:hypothetical protein